MQSSLGKKVTVWFVLVVLAVAAGMLVGYRQVSRQIFGEAQAQMQSKTGHVLDVLRATDETYSRLVRSSMRLLQILTAREGAPRWEESSNPGGLASGELYFGERPMTNDFGIVDEVVEIMGGTATLFIRDGDRFVRVTTNVKKPDGTRAVGTELDPNGPAIAAIRQGKAFYGVVDILGKPYITGYEPIRDEAGEVIGVYYVGYAIETLDAIREAMDERGVLDRGFFALLDPQDKVVFLTRGLENAEEDRAMAEAVARGEKPPSDWLVRRVPYDSWDYDVVSALYLPDVSALTFGIMWQAYGITGLVILAVLLVSFWLASKLSHALEAAEKSRTEAEEARDAAETANRTKSTFLANMSHELRTPMNAIIGYSEMLAEEAEELGQEEFIPDLKKIQSAGKHLLALINDILDLSKIEAGKMTLYVEEFDIAQMAQDVVSTIQPLLEKNGNELVTEYDADLGTMRSDLTKVRQTLFNLLSNASKFTEKGKITLSLRRIAGETGERIRMTVSDTGIGMTPEQLGRLFQAFTQADDSTTRKYGGTGLGLVISRKFCQMMGGGISVESTAGKGSTFTVDLPVEMPDPARTEAPAGATPGASRTGAGGLILVIDDDPDASDLMKRALEKSGYTVTVAASGPEGLKIAREKRPQAITLDVMMPGMDGWSVLAALKADAATADIPVIMATMVQDRQMGFALGAAEFLTKPVDQEKLRAALVRHCSQPQAEVLIVEDDAINRDMLRRMLEKENLAVREAENGSVALEMLASHPPSLILLDLMMPVMDGFQFLSAMRRNPRFATLPVIVVTAKDLNDEDRRRLNGSVQDIIQKGAMDRERLLREVCEMVSRARTASSRSEPA